MVKLMEATLQIQSTPWANLSIRGRLLTTKLRLEPLQPKDSTMTQRQNESRPVGASFNLTNEVNDDRGLGNDNGTETNGSESRKEPTNQPNGDLNGNTDNQNRGQKRSNGNNSNDDDDDSGNNSEDENPRPPKRPKISLKNNGRFTGTTTLSIRGSLRQELTTLIGLCIHPSIESRFADCQIILDLVVVRTSSLYSDGDESFPETGPPNHFYITEEATIIIGACGGYCDPPVSLHPLPQHFTKRHTTSTRAQMDVSLEASVNPKFILNRSKGS